MWIVVTTRLIADDARGHQVVDDVAVDEVVVIEYRHDVVRNRIKIIDHRGQDRFDLLLGRLEERECACTDRGRRRLQRCDRIRPERSV